MRVLFLGSLTLGLLLGVFAMLHGVERRTAGSAVLLSPTGATRARLNLPLIAAFATLFGMIGYLLLRYTTLSLAGGISIAAASGGLGILGALALIAKWAVPAARRDVIDQRYLLQGHPGRVTVPISPGKVGEVRYAVDGTSYASPALSVDGSAVPAETDVVIDRVEQGTAYVEAWVHVEKRL